MLNEVPIAEKLADLTRPSYYESAARKASLFSDKPPFARHRLGNWRDQQALAPEEITQRDIYNGAQKSRFHSDPHWLTAKEVQNAHIPLAQLHGSWR